MLSTSINESIVIKGVGAVSPGGWSAKALVSQALDETALPHEVLSREGSNHPSKVRRVPKPEERQQFARHPRLRRASAISRFVVSAGLEALGPDRAEAVRNDDIAAVIVAPTEPRVRHNANRKRPLQCCRVDTDSCRPIVSSRRWPNRRKASIRSRPDIRTYI